MSLVVMAKDAGVFSQDVVFEASVSQLLDPVRKALRAHDLDVAWALRVYLRVLVWMSWVFSSCDSTETDDTEVTTTAFHDSMGASSSLTVSKRNCQFRDSWWVKATPTELHRPGNDPLSAGDLDEKVHLDVRAANEV